MSKKAPAPVRQFDSIDDLIAAGYAPRAPLPEPQPEPPKAKEPGLMDRAGDLVSAGWQGVKSVGRRLGADYGLVAGDNKAVEDLARSQQADAQANTPAAQRALQEEIQRRKVANPDAGVLQAVGDVAGAAWSNKEGAAQLIAEQLPNAGVSLGAGVAGAKGGAALGSLAGPVGTAIGGTLGFLGGMFLGNALLETGDKGMEKAADGLTDDERRAALKEGAIKAGVITGVDAATLGAGRLVSRAIAKPAIQAGARAEAKVLADAGVNIKDGAAIVKALENPKLREAAAKAGQDAAKAASTFKRGAAKAATAGGMETVGEGVGEYYGEMAATGKADVYDAAVEALAGFAQSAPETFWTLTQSSGNNLDAKGIAASGSPAVPPAVAAAAAQPNSPLSKAAAAGAQAAPAPVEQPAGPDEITLRAQEINQQSGAILDALRTSGDAAGLKAFQQDLAIAGSPSTPPAQREQALGRLEFTVGWASQNMPTEHGLARDAGEVPPPGPKGAFKSEQEAADYIGQQRRAGGARMPAALPFQHDDGSWGVVTEGSPEFAQAQQRAQPPQAPAAATSAPAQPAAPAFDAKAAARSVLERPPAPPVQVPPAVQENQAPRSDLAAPDEFAIRARAARQQIDSPFVRAALERKFGPEVADRLAQQLTAAEAAGLPADERDRVLSDVELTLFDALSSRVPPRPAPAQRVEGSQPQRLEAAPARPGQLATTGERPRIAPALGLTRRDMPLSLDDGVSPVAETRAPGEHALLSLRQEQATTPTTDPRPATNEAKARRARRDHLKQLAANGFDTVERNGKTWRMRNTGTGQTIDLANAGDAQIARNAIKLHIDEAASKAQEPKSEAQAEAGNYKKGDRFKLNGFTIVIENPRGSTRRGTSPDGKQWESTMAHHYGDIARTEGADGDKVDVFVGPRPDSSKIFVIDQTNPDGSFDEHKVMMGFTSEADARAGYLANYEPGWDGLGAITEMTPEQFKDWLRDGGAMKPAGNLKPQESTNGNQPQRPAAAQPADAGRGEGDSSLREQPGDAATGAQQPADAGGGAADVRPADGRGDDALSTKPALSADANKAHSVKKESVLTPAGALKADARNSTAPTAPWYYQGSIDDLRMRASVTIEGRPAAGADKARALLKQLQAAQKQGWRLASYRAGSAGTVWMMERDGQFLTRAGLDNLGADVFARPEMPADGAGYEKLVLRQFALAKAFAGWLSTLTPEQQQNRGVVSRKIGETPIHEWARIEDEDKLGVSLAYYEPDSPSFKVKINAKDWGSLRRVVQAMAARADRAKAAPESDLYFIAQEAKNEANSTQQGEDAPGITKSTARNPITQTPEFRAWFGDSVVTVNGKPGGEPKVMYHGSGEVFDAFDPNRFGENTGYGDAEVGFHFADNYADADFYATKAAERLGKDEGVVRQFYLSLQNPLIVGLDESDGNAGERTQEFLDDKIAAKEYAVENGMDGIIYLYGTNVDSGYTAISFRPEQIKSAIGNRGAFDASSPDITRSTARDTLTVGLGEGEVANLELLDDEALAQAYRSTPRAEGRATTSPEQATLLRQLAALFGKQVEFFADADGKLNGADGFVKSDTLGAIYLNHTSGISPVAVLGHEVLHLLKRDNPRAYAAVARVVRKQLSADAPRLFRNDYNRATDSSNEPLLAAEFEELVADLNGNLFRDPKFWGEVFGQIQREHGKDAKGIIGKMVAAVRQLIGEVVAAFKGQEGFKADAFVNDLEAVRAALRQAMADYARANGAGAQAEMLKAEQAMKREGRSLVDEAAAEVEFSRQRAFHGTPHRGIERFSTDAVGTGEGNQAFGFGLYFADRREIAEWYREKLSDGHRSLHVGIDGKGVPWRDAIGMFSDALGEDEAQDLIDTGEDKLETYGEDSLADWIDRKLVPALQDAAGDAWFVSNDHGQLYEVEIPGDDEMLLWDKPLSEQPEKVRAALEAEGLTGDESQTGKDFYEGLSRAIANAPRAYAMTREELNDWYEQEVGYRPDEDNGEPLPIEELRELVSEFSDEAIRAGDAPREASALLSRLGVKGIKYLDGTSRDGRGDSHNYVIFSGDDVDIVRTHYSRNRMTQTPEFKRWFGDSKVVDENGQPRVVYHGTRRDFSAFDAGKLGEATKHRTAQAGFFFTDAPDVAEHFAGRTFELFPRRTEYPAGANVMPVYLSIQNPASMPAREFLARFVRGDEDFAGFARQAERDGFDGLRIEADRALSDSMGGDEFAADAWVAFRPEQIKSATGNRGTFDPANPDITRSSARNGEMAPSAPYHRFTNGKADTGIGYMMFADDVERVRNYGRNHYTFDPADVAPESIVDANSSEFRDALIAALSTHEDKLDEYQTTAEQLAAEAAPRDIVNSAGFWDAPDLVEIAWSEVLEPNGWMAVRTDDGMIVFDQGAVRRNDQGGAGVTRSSARNLAAALTSADGARAIRNAIGDLFARSGTFGLWHKTIGTQYAKAQKSPLFRRVYEAAQDFLHDTSFFANTAADEAPDLLPRLENFKDVFKRLKLSGKDKDAVAKAVFTGTLNNERYDAQQLRDKYSLTDEQIKLYGQFRAAVDLSLDQLANAEVLRLLGDDAPAGGRAMLADGRYSEFRQAARNHVAEQHTAARKDMADAKARHEKEIGDLNRRWAAEDKATPPARALGGSKGLQERRDAELAELQAEHAKELRPLEATAAKWKATEVQVSDKYERLDKLQDQGYAPLMRFGRYAVHVTDDQGESLYFGLYESQFEANRAKRELEAEFKDVAGATVTAGVMSQEAYKLMQGVSPETLALFGDATGMSKDEVFQTYLKLATANHSALRRLIHRQGIAGFNQDPTRVLAAFLTSNARRASSLLHFGEMDKAVRAAQEAKQGDVADEAFRLRDYVQNPTDEAAALKNLMFINYIGGSVASALVNLTQPMTMTLPYLSQFGGPAKAAARLGAAMKDAAGAITDPTLKAALHKAEAEGIVAPQEMHELQSEAQRSLTNHPLARKSLFLWGSLFQLAEAFNRRATFVAAYRTALAEKMADPFSFAAKAVTETQGEYAKSNRPNWARGALGGTLFTFKQFSIHYLEFFSRLPRREKVLALAMLVIFAGLQGLPGADDLDDVIDTMGQRAGYNTNAKLWKQQVLEQALGRPLAGLLLRGVTGIPGAPIDVSGRMSLGNLIPGTGMLRKDHVDKGGDVAELLGAAGGLGKQAGALANGDFEQVLPVGLQNMAKSWDMAKTGAYRDRRGNKVIDTDIADAAVKFFGFQPGDVAQEQRRASAVQQTVNMAKNVQEEVSSMWANGIFEGDRNKIAKARERLAAWNEANPDSPVQIKLSNIQRRVKAMRDTRVERLEKAAPKPMRRAVKSALDDGEED